MSDHESKTEDENIPEICAEPGCGREAVGSIEVRVPTTPGTKESVLKGLCSEHFGTLINSLDALLDVQEHINPNKELLEGMSCPECNCYGPFFIERKLIFEVYDEDMEESPYPDEDSYGWDDDSWCKCSKCSFEDRVLSFCEEGRG
jgi:hypothetical protein